MEATRRREGLAVEKKRKPKGEKKKRAGEEEEDNGGRDPTGTTGIDG